MKIHCPAKKTASCLVLSFLLLAAAGKAEETGCLSKKELLRSLTAEGELPSSLLAAPESSCRSTDRPRRGEPVGTVQTIQGTVLIIPKNGCNAVRLQKSLPLSVFQGDTLITSEKSRITLLMRDSSRLTLTAQSKMIIDQAVYDPASRRRNTSLRLLLGRLRAVVAKMTNRNSYIIETSAATAGVRGTDFAVAASRTQTTVLTGGGNSTVELTDRHGGSVTVGPLSAAGAKAACPVCPPTHVGRRALTVLHQIAPELDAAAAADEHCWLRKLLCR